MSLAPRGEHLPHRCRLLQAGGLRACGVRGPPTGPRPSSISIYPESTMWGLLGNVPFLGFLFAPSLAKKIRSIHFSSPRGEDRLLRGIRGVQEVTVAVSSGKIHALRSGISPPIGGKVTTMRVTKVRLNTIFLSITHQVSDRVDGNEEKITRQTMALGPRVHPNAGTPLARPVARVVREPGRGMCLGA